jgi:hypothetical protein
MSLTPEQVAAIWARINQIALDLQALSDSAATNIVSAHPEARHSRRGVWVNQDNAERCAEQRLHEQRTAALRRELAELRSQLPKEGMASGERILINGALGDITLRDMCEPEYSGPVNVPVDLWDWSEA